MYLNLSILNYKNIQQKCQGQKTKSKTKQHQQIKKRNMEHSTFPSSFLFYYYYSILYFFFQTRTYNHLELGQEIG